MNYPIYVLVIYIIMFVLVGGLAILVLIDPRILKSYQRAVLVNVALVALLILQNYLDYRFSLNEELYFARRITGIMGYSIRPAIIVMWLYFVRKEQRLIISWILVVINFLIHLTALFSNICFTITEENIFKRGPLGYTCHIISMIILLYLFWLSADRYIDAAGKQEEETSRDRWKQEINKYGRAIGGLVPVGCVLAIIASVFMDSGMYFLEGGLTFLTIAIVFCNTLYFIWLHIMIAKELRGMDPELVPTNENPFPEKKEKAKE